MGQSRKGQYGMINATCSGKMCRLGDFALFGKLLFMAMTLMPMLVSALTTADGVVYTLINKNEAQIGDGQDPAIPYTKSGAITILSAVDGVPVTRIGSRAFSGCSKITSVSIPSSVTMIGSEAFRNCTGLKSAVLPSGVTSIGSYAFYDCEMLGAMTIPQSVTSIGGYAFYFCSGLKVMEIPSSVVSIGMYAFGGCSGLTSIKIPSSVREIGDSAFSPCRALTEIRVSDENQNYSSLDGILYDKNQDRLLQCPAGRVEPVTIPSSVTRIDAGAFAGTALLKEHSDGLVIVDDCLIEYKGVCDGVVMIPNGVRMIADKAFYSCRGLTSVMIPSSVVSIGHSAFDGCNKLQSLTLAPGVTNIGYYAFSHCYGLTEVTIPESVKSIGAEAFSECSKLGNVSIQSDMTSIAASAFHYTKLWNDLNDGLFIVDNCLITYKGTCNGDLVIPDGVRMIADHAFESCTGLTSVIIPSGVKSIGYAAFAPYCKRLISVMIPSSVMHIGEYAFDGTEYINAHADGLVIMDGCVLDFKGVCNGAVEIPDGARMIADGAFRNCSEMTSVSIPATVTSIGEGAFCGCTSLESVVVPDCVDRLSITFPDAYAKIKDVVICDGATSIGDYAFYDCGGIGSVVIPSSVTSVGECAFQGCRGLADAAGLVIVRDVLYDYFGNTTSITIPSGVTRIENLRLRIVMGWCR